MQILGRLVEERAVVEQQQIHGHSLDLIHGEHRAVVAAVAAAVAAAVGEEECLDNGKRC